MKVPLKGPENGARGFWKAIEAPSGICQNPLPAHFPFLYLQSIFKTKRLWPIS